MYDLIELVAGITLIIMIYFVLGIYPTKFSLKKLMSDCPPNFDCPDDIGAVLFFWFVWPMFLIMALISYIVPMFVIFKGFFKQLFSDKQLK